MTARYRNEGSLPLDYSDSGGPFVAPGEAFSHDIPPEQLVSHLRSGFISRVPDQPAAAVDSQEPAEAAASPVGVATSTSGRPRRAQE